MSSSSDSTTCPHCHGSARLFSARGLKLHITRMHKDVSRPIFGPPPAVNTVHPAPNPGNVSSSLEQLAQLRASVQVLRHIPKGARSMAAGKLCGVIEGCITANGLEDWCSLLSFAYKALRTPDKTGPGTLTSKVKSNIVAWTELPSVDGESVPSRARSLTKLIESKVHEGDLRGAVRMLMNEDSFASSGPDTLAALQSKHPGPSRPLCFPLEPDRDVSSLSVKVEDVVWAIGSFYNGSAAGLDGIRPAHLKELTSASAGDNGRRLLEALTKLCNFLLSGKVVPQVCPFLYGATLCALSKKDGGIRPIAIGNTFRRLAAKLGCRAVKDDMAALLQPHQLGFGTRLGCEAAIHAVRAFASDPSNAGSIIVKLDLKNAFNSVERDVLLGEARECIPSLYPFLHQVYRSPSNLYLGSSLIPSQVGAQQGDPLGPLTFSLAIQKAICELTSPLNIWYLDDGTIGGKPEELMHDLSILLPRLKELGLVVNTAKCELFSCSLGSASAVPLLASLLPGLKELNPGNFFLLGAPIFSEGVPVSLKSCGDLLSLAGGRLGHVAPHVALILLQKCFAVPKTTYLLRTAPTWLYPEDIADFDASIKGLVESILNVTLNEDQWAQASLPIRFGGLGVRRVRDVCLPAFLASAHGVSDLVTHILSINGGKVPIPYAAGALSAWLAQGSSMVTSESPEVQRSWDDVGCRLILEGLIDRASGSDLARLRAVSRPESGAWLHALPSPHVGTLLDGDSLRVAVALRLGCDVCQPHLCICGSMVEANGHHALSCRRCAGRHPRHHALNDLVQRALVAAGVPSVLEPPGLSRTDGKRPDGLTLVPWEKGRCLVWDATCVNTFAVSHINRTTRAAGAAAEAQAAVKRQKYAPLEPNYIFVPLAVETAGCWGADALQFVRGIGSRLRERSGDPRSGCFLAQRLAIAIQRGNAASIMGSFAPGSAQGGLFD